MNTGELIRKLSEDLRPVRPVPSPLRLAAACLGLSALSALSALLAFHRRPDLAEALSSLPFLLSTAGLAASAALGCWASAALSVPGRRDPLRAVAAALGCVTAVAVALAGSRFSGGFGAEGGSGLECALGAVALGLGPLVILVLAARRRAPVRPSLSGAIAGWTAASAGATALAFSCPNDHPSHLLLWHMALPLASLAIAGGLAGSRSLRW